jgi:acetyl-CoA carboxylase biotin carboxyl carrier protein
LARPTAPNCAWQRGPGEAGAIFAARCKLAPHAARRSSALRPPKRHAARSVASEILAVALDFRGAWPDGLRAQTPRPPKSTTSGDSVRGTHMAKVIKAHITGTVWKIEVKQGDDVSEGTVVAILESMKMEMPVESEDEGKVETIHVKEGQPVSEGDPIVTLA